MMSPTGSAIAALLSALIVGQGGRRGQVHGGGGLAFETGRAAAWCPARAKLRRLLRCGHAQLLNVNVTRHTDGRFYATLTYERATCSGRNLRRVGGRVRLGVDRGRGRSR